MEIFRYSGPQFRLPGDTDNSRPETPETGEWRAPLAKNPLRAVVDVPGSKSLTNRELVLSALATGTSHLRRPLISRDSELLVGALRALGTTIDTSGPNSWTITPADELTGSTFIDCGLAGTVMRFMPPVAALALGPTQFDGDPAARERPMRGLLDALRKLGVDVSDDGRGALPFSVHGVGGVDGGLVEADFSASSQLLSGLLLSAARFETVTELVNTGGTSPSRPHIDMTVAALRDRGVTVEETDTGSWRVTPGPIAARDVTIEPDMSNAAPFFAAALVAGGSVTVENWPDTTTQVGEDFLRIVELFGGRVERDAGRVTVRAEGVVHGAELPGIDIDMAHAGELVPIVAALCALASTPSTIRGVAHIRGHETDRLRALATEINRAGGQVREREDGLDISPAPLHGAEWRSYADHRMATAGALIGLAVDGIVIDDIRVTSKTMPDFPVLWHRMLKGASATAASAISIPLL